MTTVGLIKTCVTWENELQDKSLGYMLVELYAEIARQKDMGKDLTLHAAFKVAKSMFRNNVSAYNNFVNNVALLLMASYKCEGPLADTEEIKRARQTIKTVETQIKAEVSRYGVFPVRASIYRKARSETERKPHTQRSTVGPAATEDMFGRYLQIIRTKLLSTNEAISKVLKRQFEESTLLHKGSCIFVHAKDCVVTGNEFVTMMTGRLKFPLTGQEAYALKMALEKGHADQIFLQDLLRFLSPSSIRSLNMLKDVMIDEDLLYVGIVLVADKYAREMKHRLTKEIDEPLLNSFQFYNE